MFAPGDTVDNYVIERRLGAGGFGEVYQATERSPRRPVALKFMRPELAADPDFLRRFQREVDAMAAVEHPSVVPIYAHGNANGREYFAMRYVAGGSLADVLDHLTLQELVDVLDGVAEGLDHCHDLGIVHRDLKPANVLVDGRRGLLTDFGIASAADGSTLTAPGRPIGTPAYMAPEALMGGRATAKTDLWALGAIAYRVATSRFPRGHSQPPDADPVPPSRLNDRLGPDVDRVILRALAFDPAHRHGDARAFVSDLREALRRPSAPRALAARRMWSVAGAVFVLIPMVAYGLDSLGDRECHPSYTGACLKPDAGDYDCRSGDGDGPHYVDRPVRVIGDDVFSLDRDGDGHAC